jgi:hypothetical protein
MSDKSNPVVEEVVVEKPKRGRPKKGKKVAEPQPEPEPVPAPKPVKAKAVKMSEESKTELREFMLTLHKKNKDLSVKEGKSARMKVMSRMRKGMTAKEAWADVNQ